MPKKKTSRKTTATDDGRTGQSSRTKTPKPNKPHPKRSSRLAAQRRKEVHIGPKSALNPPHDAKRVPHAKEDPAFLVGVQALAVSGNAHTVAHTVHAAPPKRKPSKHHAKNTAALTRHSTRQAQRKQTELAD